MKMFGAVIAMAFAISTLFAAPSLAGDMQGKAGMQENMGMHSFYTADDLIGKEVMSTDGKHLGEVENLIIGNDGSVNYVLLSRGGVFDVGERYIAIPWAFFESSGTDTVTMSITADKLERAPVFDRENLGSDWEGTVQSYFGQPESSKMQGEMKGKMEGHGEAEMGTTGEAGATRGFETRSEFEKQGMMMEGEFSNFRAGTLIGKAVLGSDGEELGDLDNIVLDHNGDVKYAIISSGGFLGMGEKLVALPWSMVQFNTEQDALVAGVSRDKVRNAPSFDEESYGAEWETEVRTYYGTEQGMNTGAEFGAQGEMEKPGAFERSGEAFPGGAEATDGILKTSELMKKTITSQQGEDVGTVHDLILSKEGKVSYLIISTEAGRAGEFVAIPWQIVKVEPQEDTITLLVAKEKLDNAPKFTESDWQKINDPQWNSRIHSYYGVEKGKMHEGSMMEKGQMEKGQKQDSKKSDSFEHGATSY